MPGCASLFAPSLVNGWAITGTHSVAAFSILGMPAWSFVQVTDCPFYTAMFFWRLTSLPSCLNWLDAIPVWDCILAGRWRWMSTGGYSGDRHHR